MATEIPSLQNRFRGKQHSILVAIKFDDSQTALMKVAEGLALRTGLRLRCVHVLESKPESTLGRYYPGELYFSRLTYARQRQLIQDAEDRLTSLQKELNPSLAVETAVHLGHAAQLLMADASTQRVSCILSAHHVNAKRFLPKGFSTSLTLLAEAPVPVLSLPVGSLLFTPGERLRVLLADDLRESCEKAVAVACELVAGLENAELLHAHIYSEKQEDLEEWSDFAGELLFARDYAASRPLDERALVSHLETKFHALLGQRLEKTAFGRAAKAAEFNNSYRRVLATGSVLEQLSKLVSEIAPDLIIFGRHHLIHRRPLSLGKMPFYAMLGLNQAILSVPS